MLAGATVARDGFSGVRAQAVARDGRLVDDFVLFTTQTGVHVRNAPRRRRCRPSRSAGCQPGRSTCRAHPRSDIRYRIDVIPGDGIGTEVVPSAVRCLERLAQLEGFELEWRMRDWGSERYLKDGAMMPSDGLDQMADGDATFLGAVG